MVVKQLSIIKSGVFAKSQANPNLFYIQASDFDDERNWKKNLKPSLVLNPSLQKHVLNNGDILFVAKGRMFFAVVYKGEYSPAVASGTFLIIKTDHQRLIPEFLAWYLNHPKTIIFLDQLSKGSSMPMISKSVLEEIEITLPTITQQEKITELSALQQKEQQLLTRIQFLHNDYVNELTYKIFQQ
ncbi:MAG: hypothetical protein CFE23_11880 [Flavobacterium sp. BFFFF1]|uniref:restriction endonuclease subunit S n=1 Tax=Flavobacterium sp. BFFFF1 TaxID=2015557 RepID=UPI000BC7D206|nr:restriction endonuclease subunit S [Flavobacterium sp. BFFFF1]OYU79947.1 MAG: hypothetical protein CFE23_11880 [Flavobacterium sp. BFFFF1]